MRETHAECVRLESSAKLCNSKGNAFKENNESTSLIIQFIKVKQKYGPSDGKQQASTDWPRIHLLVGNVSPGPSAPNNLSKSAF